MKFIIKHEMKGRMRVRLFQKRMTYEQADILQYYLLCNESVKLAKVYDRTCDAVINYTGDREDVIRLLQEFHYQTVEVPADVLAKYDAKKASVDEILADCDFKSCSIK